MEKMKNFNRETSLNEQFELLIFKMQKSTGKAFPSRLKQSMLPYLLFRRGIAFYEIKNNNKRMFEICRNEIIKQIHQKLFNYLKEDFNIYFNKCEDEFVFKIFECMKPKIFSSKKL